MITSLSIAAFLIIAALLLIKYYRGIRAVNKTIKQQKKLLDHLTARSKRI
ncbi:hypothetical protein [Deminuibacter soli]|nr:hypothetical protein [Deminuibacter soli]